MIVTCPAQSALKEILAKAPYIILVSAHAGFLDSARLVCRPQLVGSWKKLGEVKLHTPELLHGSIQPLLPRSADQAEVLAVVWLQQLHDAVEKIGGEPCPGGCWSRG